MKDKPSKYIIPILSLMLAVSLIFGWTFLKKTEAMHYGADEAIGYGLKGISHELNCTLESLKELRAYGALEPEKFSRLCEQLDRDVFYSVETLASFDYGLLGEGYNDYDLFWFYCYVNDLFRVSQNFDKMSTSEIQSVYMSLSKVCNAFNQQDWNLPKSDNYFSMSLEAYDFERDPSGVRNRLKELEELVAAEQEMLQAYLQPESNVGEFVNTPEYTQEEITAAIDIIKAEFEVEWSGCILRELYYAGNGVSAQHQAWADRNNADDVIVLLSAFEVGSNADSSLTPNSTYDNYMWILVRTNGGEWVHVDHGHYIPIL